MNKGKIKKDSVLICKKCYNKIKLKEDADRLSNSTGYEKNSTGYEKNPLPGEFKDIFSKFRK